MVTQTDTQAGATQMDHDTVYNTIFASAPSSAALFGPDGSFTALLKLDPMGMMQQGMNFYRQLFEIAAGSSTISPDARDWRFKDETWKTNPFTPSWLRPIWR